MRSRGAAGVGVALAVALGAGCGGDDGGDPVSPRIISGAAARTEAQRSVRLDLDIQARLPEVDRPIDIAGDGLSDAAGRRGRIELDLSDAADVAAVEGDPDEGDAGFRAQEVFEGPLLYVRFPALSAQLAGAREWLRIDGRRPLPFAQGLDLTQLAQIGGDSARMLDQLRAIGPAVTRVGSETVRGAETEHYRGTVQLRRWPEIVAPPDRESTRATVDRLVARTGAENVATEVWIDARQLVRRIRQHVDGKSAAGEPIVLDTTIELYDFGIPIAVAPPPAEQVTDIGDLAESAPE